MTKTLLSPFRATSIAKFVAPIAALLALFLQLVTLSAVRKSEPDILQGISIRIQRHVEFISAGGTPPAYRDSALLQGYLAGLRKDGVAAHAAEKQRIESISANLSEIDALLSVYKPKGDRQLFEQRQREFESYSSAWRNRAGSILGIYLLGGNLPTEPISFPETFRAAVADQEDASGIF